MDEDCHKVAKSLAFVKDDVLMTYQYIRPLPSPAWGCGGDLPSATPHPHPHPGSIPPLHRDYILDCHTLPLPQNPHLAKIFFPENSGTYNYFPLAPMVHPPSPWLQGGPP